LGTTAYCADRGRPQVSTVDTALQEELRQVYLGEIQAWLPAFLSGATVERLDPLAQVAELLALREHDLRAVLAVHLLLQEDVERFVTSLAAGLRRPATSSSRPRQSSRAIAGGIDWAATVRARATGSPLEGAFVTRPAVRLFDVPENRVLAWTVRELVRLSELASPVVSSSAGTGWMSRLLHVEDILGRARRTAWLRSLPATRPSAADVASLGASRSYFYKVLLANAAKVLRRFDSPSVADVTALLTSRWFEPSRDWQLFELAVLLRLHRAFDAAGTQRRVRPLGHTRGPFATFDLPDDVLVRLWYQSWPASSGPSEQLDAARRYSINTGGSRPDIVIEVQTKQRSAALLLELKATRSGEYLAAGLLQLLAYLRDRPTLFRDEPRVAWLVAPAAPSFVSAEPEQRQLWAVDADALAEQAVRTVRDLAASLKQMP
jgi:hypothetical protein